MTQATHDAVREQLARWRDWVAPLDEDSVSGDLARDWLAKRGPDIMPLLLDALEAAYAALGEIQRWSEAYPEDVFIEPDWKRARQLLESGGITLDAVSAGAIRPVVQGIGERAVAAHAAIAATLEGANDA